MGVTVHAEFCVPRVKMKSRSSERGVRWPIALKGEAGGLELEQTTVASTDGARIPKAVHSLGRLEPKGTLLSIAAPSGNEGNRLERLLV